MPNRTSLSDFLTPVFVVCESCGTRRSVLYPTLEPAPPGIVCPNCDTQRLRDFFFSNLIAERASYNLPTFPSFLNL